MRGILAIIQLDKELINKIAAGEVIERPASVVKELIENSIDAGAKNIVIEAREGGKSYLRIRDDGSGMNEADVKISIKKHTTSKIKSAEDLFKITSLGFRGEALSSIAAISNMEIQTKTEDALEGIKLEIEAGKILDQKSIGCAKGTTIIVKDLFFNTPARKKHLKDMSVEFRHISEIVTRYALSNPEIGFRLSHNNKWIFQSPPTDDKRGNIIHIFGKDFGKEMIRLNEKTDNVEISGFIAKPSLTRADKSSIYTFVNGRYVKNKMLSDAVYDAYHTLLGTQRYPVAILDFTIDEEKIDVNVHPTKIEIRIEKEAHVYQDILDSIKKKLESTELIPKVDVKEKQVQFAEPEQKKKETEYKNKPVDKQVSKQEEIKIDDFKLETPAYNILGKIHKTFILIETKQGLRIVDQHAAHERILYEQLMKEFGKQGVKKQQLLQPIKVELKPDELQLIEQNKDILDFYGFDA
jgi:DNA mismatch repair protein MutL